MSAKDYMKSPIRDELASRGLKPCELCGSCGMFRGGKCPRCGGSGEVKAKPDPSTRGAEER